MPSGWKCDLLFKNKIKELIDKHNTKERGEYTKLVKEVMGMCGVSERQARSNIKSIQMLMKIESNKTEDFFPISQETIIKKLNPHILLEIAKTPEDKQQEVVKKIEEGEIKTGKDVKQFRETGNTEKLKSLMKENYGVNIKGTKNVNVTISLELDDYKKLEDHCKPIPVDKWAENIIVKEIKKVLKFA